MLTDLLIVALASSFLVSFAERWIEEPGVLRGLIALAGSIAGVLIFGYTEILVTAYMSFASAFLALIFMLVGERLATPPPVLLESRRR